MASIHLERFNVKECTQWITSNGFHTICLYFLPQFYCVASEIATVLKQQCNDSHFLVMISGSSGVDTVKYRTKDPKSSPDAVIYFGASCLCTAKYSSALPILFVPLEPDTSELKYISECLKKFSSEKRILLVADLTNSWLLLEENLSSLFATSSCTPEICRLRRPDASNWHFSSTCTFEAADKTKSNCLYVPYSIPNSLAEYDLVLFVGECKNLEFVLNCRKLVVVNPQKRSREIFDGPKEFRKRSSLIEKFKSQSGKQVGVVFVNYTQSVTPIMSSAKTFCKRQKKLPYFLSLNQNDYELRLGNFGQLESFVLVNSCDCTAEVAQATAKYIYPIIFWKEFLIACSQRISYGGIIWNEDATEEAGGDEDDEGEEDRDEESMKLVERDLFKRPDGWFGLVVDAGSEPVGQIKEGLRGIPSGYTNEEELF
ncbi:Diphthamide biosynthesis protein 2 [Tyrophagus putrescentiae]|nr:Diphthamide biosynthesis protein 2 [Tyrophagus putrescentiae]